jgi:hypothetical protein
MKNKKLLGGMIAGMLLMSGGNALAQDGEKEFSQQSPYYILIMWGQESLAKGLPEKLWNGTIMAENAEFTLGREILIDSGDSLNNSVNDVGVLDDQMEIEASTRHQQGVILRVFEETGKEGSLDVNMGGLEAEVNLKDFNNSAEVEEVGNENGFLKISRLQNNYGESLDKRNQMFRNKLAILRITIGIEEWAEAKYEEGKISETVFKSLQESLEMSLKGNFEDAWKIRQFELRYQRIRNLVNNEEIAPGVLAGAIQRLLNDVQN